MSWYFYKYIYLEKYPSNKNYMAGVLFMGEIQMALIWMEMHFHSWLTLMMAVYCVFTTIN